MNPAKSPLDREATLRTLRQHETRKQKVVDEREEAHRELVLRRVNEPDETKRRAFKPTIAAAAQSLTEARDDLAEHQAVIEHQARELVLIQQGQAADEAREIQKAEQARRTRVFQDLIDAAKGVDASADALAAAHQKLKSAAAVAFNVVQLTSGGQDQTDFATASTGYVVIGLLRARLCHGGCLIAAVTFDATGPAPSVANMYSRNASVAAALGLKETA